MKQRQKVSLEIRNDPNPNPGDRIALCQICKRKLRIKRLEVLLVLAQHADPTRYVYSRY